jgi:transcriptional antiterminator RfaH
MEPSSTLSNNLWCVVRTHPRQEHRASDTLKSAAVETFLPCIRPAARRRGPAAPVSEPLFPQYLFARLCRQTSIHNLRFTRGVQGAVCFGDQIAVVDDDTIAFLRTRVDADGLIVLRPFEEGDAVAVVDGPFRALKGVVERYLPGRQRVTILLAAAAHMRVDVPAECLELE